MCNMRQVYCRNSGCRGQVGTYIQQPCAHATKNIPFSPENQGEDKWYFTSKAHLEPCNTPIVARRMRCSYRICPACLIRAAHSFIVRIHEGLVGEQPCSPLSLLARRWNGLLAAEWGTLWCPTRLLSGQDEEQLALPGYPLHDLEMDAMLRLPQPMAPLDVYPPSPGDIHAREAWAALTPKMSMSASPCPSACGIMQPSPDLAASREPAVPGADESGVIDPRLLYPPRDGPEGAHLLQSTATTNDLDPSLSLWDDMGELDLLSCEMDFLNQANNGGDGHGSTGLPVQSGEAPPPDCMHWGDVL